MYIEIVFKDFKLNQFTVGCASLLVLIEVLGEDVCAPGVGLTPLLSLLVEKLEPEDAFAELIHHVAP